MNRLVKEIVKKLGEEGIPVTAEEVFYRTNNVSRVGICFRNKERGLTISQECLKIGTVDGLVSAIREKLTQSVSGLYEILKSNVLAGQVVLKIVGKEENEEYLSSFLTVDYLDMGILFQVPLQADAGTFATLTKENADHLGFTKEDLLAIGVRNVMSNAVMDSLIRVCIKTRISQEPEINLTVDKFLDTWDGIEPAVLTISQFCHGAGVIACTDLLGHIAERIGGGFYILPSSIHECLLIPDRAVGGSDDIIKEMRNMILCANRNDVCPSDKLTDSLYHYSLTDHRVSIV